MAERLVPTRPALRSFLELVTPRPPVADDAPPGMRRFVGGTNVKRALSDVLDLVRQVPRYTRLGSRLPTGVLLCGPSGAGKALLAQALAEEAAVPFQDCRAWKDGAGLAQALSKAAGTHRVLYLPAVETFPAHRAEAIFSLRRDDALGWPLLIAGTSRPEAVDATWFGPGRLERRVLVEYPDRQARGQLLRRHLEGRPQEPDVDVDKLAALTRGYGATALARLVDTAASRAARAARPRLDQRTLEDAWCELTGITPEQAVEITYLRACHQAGHALLAEHLPRATLPEQTSVLADHLPYAVDPVPDYPLQQSHLLDRIGVLLGGRVAEGLLLGEVSSAVEADLVQAQTLARRMVIEWGMGERLLAPAPGDGPVSDQALRLLEEEVRRILHEVETAIRHTLEAQRPALEALTQALLDKEQLSAGEVRALLEGHRG